MRHILTRIGVIGWLTLLLGAGQCSAEAPMNNAMTLIPNPTMTAVLGGSYKPDRSATEAALNARFHGQTAQQVVHQLEREGYHIFYDSPEDLSITLKIPLGLIIYSAMISFHFENGLFAGSELVASGVM
ncbi:MAG: hypothetical protein Q4G26_16860 [Paracoccus sp. (in: a-proteobacteria)]|nr:hypothetical protein [Paracoccus sp. (in: a-proteobacteria)]